MVAGICTEERPSLDEASKRWRMKRRRPPETPRHGPPSTQTQPLPSGMAPAVWAGAADAVAVRNEGFKPLGSCPWSKKRRYRDADEAVTRSAGEDVEEGAAGQENGTTIAAKRKNGRRRKHLSKNTLVGMSPDLVPKLVLLPQEVAWSLTDDCRSEGGAADHQRPQTPHFAARPATARIQRPHTDEMEGLNLLPQQHHVRAPGGECANGGKTVRRSGRNDINSRDGSHEGIHISTNAGDVPHEIRSDGEGCRRNKSSGIPTTSPANRAAAGNHNTKAIENHDCEVAKGSSGRQRQGFSVAALVPHILPTDVITSATTATTLVSQAQPRPTQVMFPCADAEDEAQAAPGKNRQPPGPLIVSPPNSFGSRISAPKTPTREISRPPSVTSGLRELGVRLVDSSQRRAQQAKSDTSFSPPSRRYRMDASGGGATPAAALSPQRVRLDAVQSGEAGARSNEVGRISTRQRFPQGRSPQTGEERGTGAPTVSRTTIGLTAEALGSPGIALDRLGRATVIEKFMVAFDEVWPADLPDLRPLRLNLRRSCGRIPARLRVSSTGRNTASGASSRGDDEGESVGGPVFLMPMHRQGKGIEGREAVLFAEPPPLKREDEKVAMSRDRYCFRDENRYGKSLEGKDNSGDWDGDDSMCARRKWARCKLSETGVETWRWEWSPEARMMLGKLALWKGALLVSRTQTVLTVFGLGMAGRVVVEGAPYPRGLVIEAYVPASSETCELFLSVEDLKFLFRNDPDNMWVGQKGNMVLEVVKMLYFDYTLETEVLDASSPSGVCFKSCHYSDRAPWACLDSRRDSDFDLHWERRRNARGSGSEAPTGAGLSGGAHSTVKACVPDERAVWIIQRLQVRSTQNLVDADIGAIARGSGSDGGKGGRDGSDGDSLDFGAGATKIIRDRAVKTPKKTGAPLKACREPCEISSSHAMRTQRKADQVSKRGPTGANGRVKAGAQVRVRAFVIRVEQYKEERRHAEEAKEAKLQAWLAIKKRFRGLTLGTVVRVSGRLLALMVYEFPDQPGNLQVKFTNPRSGETYRVNLGFRVVSGFARRNLSVTSSSEDWTLGERRRIIKTAIKKTCALLVTEEEDAREIGHVAAGRNSDLFDAPPAASLDNAALVNRVGECSLHVPTKAPHCSGNRGIDVRCRSRGRGYYYVVRCLGRSSTAARTREASTASRGFTRPRNDHQLQQSCPKDHRSCSLRERLPVRDSNIEFARLPLSTVAFAESGGDAQGRELQGGDEDHVCSPPVFDSPPSGDPSNQAASSTRKPTTGGGSQTANSLEVSESLAANSCRSGASLRRIQPRRDCGRGRRLCGGIARVGDARGIFCLLRGDWVGSEQDFLLDWYHSSGFRPSGHGPVEPHTTFTLQLSAQDLALVTEGTGLMIVAEETSKRARNVDDTFCVPKNEVVDRTSVVTEVWAGTRRSEATSGPEISSRAAMVDSRLPEERNAASLFSPPGERAPGGGNFLQQGVATVGSGMLLESEAWERLAREVLRKCFWKSAESSIDDQPIVTSRANFDNTTSEPQQRSLEQYIVSQVSRPEPSSTQTVLGEARRGSVPSDGVAAADIRLALGTCIFRRVIKVAGSGILPMYLLVVVSQWHDALVVRCYDFISGESRQAESPDPAKDSALISEFEKLSRVERDMQLQVMLDDLIVFDDSDNSSIGDENIKNPPPKESNRDSARVSWAVKFADGGAASIVIDDAGRDLYDAQVEEQMAAAAAQVEKRREETQRVQRAAREKDRRARERQSKREAKRREAQAKSRRGGAKGSKGASARWSRKTHGGGRTNERGTEEGESDHSSSGDASSVGGDHRDGR